MKSKLANEWAKLAQETLTFYDQNEKANEYHFTKFGESMVRIGGFDPRANSCCGDHFDRMWVIAWFGLHRPSGAPCIAPPSQNPDYDDIVQRASCFIAIQSAYAICFAAWLGAQGADETLKRCETSLSSNICIGSDGYVVPVGVE